MSRYRLSSRVVPYSKRSFDHSQYWLIQSQPSVAFKLRASSTRRDTFTTFHIVKEQPSYYSSWQCQTQTPISRCLRLATTRCWWRMTGSNRRPPACKAGALPAELIPQFTARSLSAARNLVGLVGLEPTTPALSRRCSNHLSYRPLAVTSNKPISVDA